MNKTFTFRDLRRQKRKTFNKLNLEPLESRSAYLLDPSYTGRGRGDGRNDRRWTRDTIESRSLEPTVSLCRDDPKTHGTERTLILVGLK